MTIFAATTNAGKIRDFSVAGALEGVEVEPLPGIAAMPEPVEDATTFIGNAELKASAYSRLAPGLLVLADDSGLEVEALGGAPGVRSARFADDAGFTASGAGKDERNNAYLLARLDALPRTREGVTTRTAKFVCALALARDGEVILRAEGSVDGHILEHARGTDGFGYDPLFLVPSLGRTMAELTREEKWAVSHRGRAFSELLKAFHSGQPARL